MDFKNYFRQELLVFGRGRLEATSLPVVHGEGMGLGEVGMKLVWAQCGHASCCLGAHQQHLPGLEKLSPGVLLESYTFETEEKHTGQESYTFKHCHQCAHIIQGVKEISLEGLQLYSRPFYEVQGYLSA